MLDPIYLPTPVDFKKLPIDLRNFLTPQPNRSKVFELQQSNQGYGETQGAQEVQKTTFGKYFTEPFLR